MSDLDRRSEGNPPPAAAVPPPLPKRPPPLPPSSRRSVPPPLRRRTVLAPAELERFGSLLLFARSTVEGYFAGKHKSIHQGSSVEFSEYKEYVPGDDPKRIDWRAYGRSRRLFVRQYEAETDMVVYLLVDVSASMSYAGPDPDSKFMLAAKVAAALSYLMIQQGDKVALALFADKIKKYCPPGGTRSHLHELVGELEKTTVDSLSTRAAEVLDEANELFKKRGRLIVLSDFWGESDTLFDSLSRFVHRRFEVLLLQVVHSHELDLPLVPTTRFRDLETQEVIELDPAEIRQEFRLSARLRVDRIASEAVARRIAHSLVHSDRPYLDAIEAYLGFRGKNAVTSP